MAQYVDGFVIVVPAKKFATYKKYAKLGCKVWMSHGALDYRETVGDEIQTTMGKSFAKLTGAKPSDKIIFAWITFPSKAARNRINKKVMEDPRMDPTDMEMTFGMHQMSYAGFTTLVKS